MFYQVFTMSDTTVQQFLDEPSITNLERFKLKKHWKGLADHYNLTVGGSLRLRDIKDLVLHHLVEDDIIDCEHMLETQDSGAISREKQVELEIAKTQLEALKLKERLSQQELTRHSEFSFKTAISLLPSFREDDPDEFFFLFEKLAKLHNWPELHWPNLVAKSLMGRALEVYTHLSLDLAREYDSVKQAVLDAYQQVPEAYRQQFRNYRKTEKQTYVEFAQRKSRLLGRWLRSLSVDNDFDTLVDMIVLEDIKNSMPQPLRNHLEQQRLYSLTKATVAADTWISSNVYSFPRSNATSSSSSGTYIPRTPTPSSAPPKKGAESHPFKRPNSFVQRTPSSNTQGERSGPSFTRSGGSKFCRYCKKNDHEISECPALARKNGGLGQTGPARPVSVVSRTPPAENKVSTSKTEAKVHPALAPFLSSGTIQTGGPDCPPVPITILRDTGAVLSLALASTIKDVRKALTGETVLVRGVMGDGTIPLGRVHIESELVSGDVLVGVVNELPVANVSMLLGNDLAGRKTVPDPVLSACPTEDNNTLELEAKHPGLFPACAVTRSMNRSTENLEPKPSQGHVITEGETLTELFTEEIGQDSPTAEIIATPGSDVITRERILVEQGQDPFLQKLLAEAVTEAEATQSPTCFYKKGGILMRKFRPVDAPADQEWRTTHQVVIPPPLRQQILEIAHEKMGGHMGVRKTYARVLEHFYWPKLMADVALFCRTCHECQIAGKSGRPIPPAPLQPIPAVGEPFDKLVIDCVGPLPKSRRGHQYLLTVVDAATRYPEAFPLRKIDGTTIAQVLTKFFCRVGLPTHIHTDRGTNFTSKVIQQVLETLGVKQIFGSAYHPQSQGAVERFHRTLKQMLRAWCMDREGDWDEGVDIILFAIRDSPSESLGYSPFELVYGHKPRGPLKALKECMLAVEGEESKSPVIHVKKLRERLSQALKLARENLQGSQEKMKKEYDSAHKAVLREFSVGDQVLVFLPVHHQPFQSKMCGPYRVVQRSGLVNYVVETPDRRKSRQLVHVNLMRPYHSREQETHAIAVVCDGVIEVDNADTLNNVLDGSDGKIDNSTVLGQIEEKLHHLTPAQVSDISHLLDEFHTIFGDSPLLCPLLCHDITLSKDARPIRQAPYRLNTEKREKLRTEIRRLQDQGLITPSLSPWASPVVMVPKPDGSLRLCVDYRKVNAMTEADSHPLPRIDDIIDDIAHSKYVSTFDLVQGYHQVALTDRAKPISAFITPDGLFEYSVMPFGLRNAPATFQRLMSHIIQELKGVRCYLDDLVVFSDTWEEHVSRLRSLFEALTTANLTVNLTKSVFGHGTVTFLGHQVGQGQVAPRSAKVEAIRSFPTPVDKKGVMRWLGLTGYFRRFCRNYASIAVPLTNLLSTKRQFVWTKECDDAFNALKQILVNNPVLRAPDLQKKFVLQVDASDLGAGAVLLQEGQDDKTLHPVCYYSSKFKGHQTRYATIEKEALALIMALERFKVYISAGQTLEVYTDHNPLAFIEKMKHKNQRLLRWSLALQEFNLDIRHIKGRENVIADCLSRT